MRWAELRLRRQLRPALRQLATDTVKNKSVR